MKYRLRLAYDGTGYCGWQVQAGLPTIQEVFNRILEKFEGAPVVLHAAGRTDAGVHAEGQVVSFRLSREWAGLGLRQALNGNLPPAIRVLEAASVEEDFHARFDAREKTYRYQLYQAEVMSPFDVRYAWHYPYSLDQERLWREGQALLGTHDFTAFTVANCEAKTKVRTIRDLRITSEGPLLKFSFTGDGFLRYQVRTMVSALLDASRGRLKAGSISAVLESRDRSLISAPAPPQGLTLVKVGY